MNKFVGKTCPYCKTVFSEYDDIVVCSDCDMPHHKDCWVENKGCTTFGCQGTIQGIDFGNDTSISSAPKYEIRDHDTFGIQNQLEYCTKCGAHLGTGNSFCGKCGTPIATMVQGTAGGNRNTFFDRVSSGIISNIGVIQTKTYFDYGIQPYIGKNEDYYMGEFTKLKDNGKYNSWNTPAFFIPAFWCLYRKMYIPGGIILAIDFLLALIGGIFSSVISLAFAVIVGIFANYLYMWDLERRLNKERGLPDQLQFEYMEEWSGTTVTVPVVVAVIYVLLCIIIFV